jgi:hypothetical protein
MRRPGWKRRLSYAKKSLICYSVKRLAAILLMGILFFNWYGYQLLTRYMQVRSDRCLEARLDRNEYDESQLISLKIPITALAYYSSSSEFQRVDGQIEIGGVHYKYVKRRIFGDSLELLCIANHTAMKLQKMRGDWGKKATSYTFKHISTDYSPTTVHIAVTGMPALAPARGGYAFPYLPSCYSPADEIPPDGTPVLS